MPFLLRTHSSTVFSVPIIRCDNLASVPFGVVEAINGNIRTLLRRGRGHKNLNYLLLKAQRMAITKTEFIVLRKAA